MSRLIKFYHDALQYDDEGMDVEQGKNFVLVRSRKKVCPSCGGEGFHFRSDLDESRMREMYAEDGRDDFDARDYSVRCGQCEGKNVIDDIDWDSFEREYPSEYRRICDWNLEMAEHNRYAAAERAYCGY